MTITIGGAGAAGLSCAFFLSRAGKSVHVFEKEHTVGQKHGTNVFAIKNYSSQNDVKKRLEHLFDCTFDMQPKYRVIKISPKGKKVTLHSPTPLFYSVLRGSNPTSLDVQLFRACEAHGVRFTFGKAVTRNEVDVIAYGHEEKNILGHGVTITTDEEDVFGDAVLLYYTNRYAPAGYTYALSHGNAATICSVTFDPTTFSHASQRFTQFLAEQKAIHDIVTSAKTQEWFTQYSYYGLPRGYEQLKFHIGEAAGFVEGARGFGLYHALVSGYLCAESIIHQKNYDLLWMHELLEELRKSLAEREKLHRMSDEDYERFIASLEGINIRDYIRIKEKFYQTIE